MSMGKETGEYGERRTHSQFHGNVSAFNLKAAEKYENFKAE
jgi:hypothetical protein